MKEEKVKILEESYSIKAKNLKFCNVFIFKEKNIFWKALVKMGIGFMMLKMNVTSMDVN